jgi:hypothetical protein
LGFSYDTSEEVPKKYRREREREREREKKRRGMRDCFRFFHLSSLKGEEQPFYNYAELERRTDW